MATWSSDELNALHAGVMDAASRAAADGIAWETTQSVTIEENARRGKGLSDPKATTPPRVGSPSVARHSFRQRRRVAIFGTVAAGSLITAIYLDAHFHRKAQDELTQKQIVQNEEQVYRKAVGNIASLNAYLSNCTICAFASAARNEIQSITHSERTQREERSYQSARGNVELLKTYVNTCSVCAFKSAAAREINDLERKQIPAQEEKAYRAARGSLELLMAYVRECRICTFEAAARGEITTLEREAKFFAFGVCNHTSYRASLAVAGRRDPETRDWSIEGWWALEPGQCIRAGRYAKGSVYAMARVSGSTQGWRGKDMKICIALSSPYKRVQTSGYKCGPNEKLESFREINATSDFTWTLDEQPTESDELFTFEVCNRSAIWAAVAVSGVETPGSGLWIVQGWWHVGPGQCQDLGKFTRGTFYAVAQQLHNSTSGWKGHDLRLCVEYPGPFRRINRGDERCSAIELESFRRFDVTNDRLRWTLNP